MNSRDKGKRGEREFAALLREHGFDGRRGQQYRGAADSPDVVSDALAWLHVEVKRVQNLNLVDACAQAEGDGANKPWIVAHRRNHAPWLITMRAETFFDFLRGVLPPEANQQSNQCKRSNNSMRIKTSSGNFQPCPEYTGSAVCVDVTPLKTVQTQYGPKEKFRFVFEVGEKKEDGTPWCVWSAPFTPSYHENSALRPFLRKWMGRELTAEEIKTFDTEDMLGRTAHITVIHEHSDGEVYTNIALIQPDKAAEALNPSGKFVRMKDRPPKDQSGAAPTGAGGAGGGGYRRVDQPASDGDDLGATKIHVGRCKGLEVRDLAPEQVQALIENWLPTAKANPKPSADDKRLMAALDWWQATQKPAADDNIPY